MLFGNVKPRGYHHKYIYVDERKEFLERLEKKHEMADDGNDISDGYSPRIAGQRMFRRRENRAGKINNMVVFSSFAVLFIVLCFVAWLYSF